MKRLALFFVIWVILSFLTLGIFFGLHIINIQAIPELSTVNTNPFVIIPSLFKNVWINWQASLIEVVCFIIAYWFSGIPKFDKDIINKKHDKE
jgi:hypothetical protein